MTLGPGQCQYVILALAMHGISVQTVLHMVFVMPRMSQQDRAIAVGLLEANWSVKGVARRFFFIFLFHYLSWIDIPGWGSSCLPAVTYTQ